MTSGSPDREHLIEQLEDLEDLEVDPPAGSGGGRELPEAAAPLGRREPKGRDRRIMLAVAGIAAAGLLVAGLITLVIKLAG